MNAITKPSASARQPALDRGLEARRLAVRLLRTVLERRVAFEDALDSLLREENFAALAERDVALARSIALASLRRLGTIRMGLAARMAKGLPKNAGPLEAILVAAAAQILFMSVPDHAAVDCAVELAREDRRSYRYEGLANAVLRRLSREKDDIEAAGALADLPGWLARSWIAAYGESRTESIAAALRHEMALDLTVKADPAAWAEKLGGHLLPTGSIRLGERTAVRDLSGYDEGAWWVQDAAAAIPARLLQPAPGETIADLCAAPGGKTAQLAASGAGVVAIDRSAKRLERLLANMLRLGLQVETLVADATELKAGPFDAVLLDAPCSATGTIRRHPDVAWTKTPEDVAALAGLQARLIDHAGTLVKPGGRLVYSTCSLEPSEGEERIAAFLASHPDWRRAPIQPAEVPGLEDAITQEGDLRTLPDLWPASDPRLAGVDGFFAARLVRQEI